MPNYPSPQAAFFAPIAGFPNALLPVLIYRKVLQDDDMATAFKRRFASNGWTGSWRNGIYDFDHFHSTAHEVLGTASGTVEVRLGADTGETFHLAPGDVVVLPAGTAHRRINAESDLVVVGAYAEGRDWDTRRGSLAELDEALANIATVPLPKADPISGPSGPLVQAWTQISR